MRWTQEQIEEILDKLSNAFVEQVEASGGKASVRDIHPSPSSSSESRDRLCEACRPVRNGDVRGHIARPRRSI